MCLLKPNSADKVLLCQPRACCVVPPFIFDACLETHMHAGVPTRGLPTLLADSATSVHSSVPEITLHSAQLAHIHT